MDHAQQLAPVLDNTLSALDEALANCESLQRENQALQEKLAKQEQVYLEKVASVKQLPSIDQDKVNQVLDRLETLSLMPSEWREKMATQLLSNPNNSLSLILELTSNYMAAHSEGTGVRKEASDFTAVQDPDGWVAAANGEEVVVKK